MHKTINRMKLKAIASIATLTIIAAAGGSTAMAATGPVGQWYKVCTNGHNCGARFQTQPGDLNSFQITTGTSSLGPLAAAKLSPNADLPFGATWQIDQGRQIRIPFMKCNGTTCLDQLVINADYLNQMRSGSVLRLSVREDGVQRAITIRLKGFGAVYDGK
jgi:invasion protein IalB